MEIENQQNIIIHCLKDIQVFWVPFFGTNPSPLKDTLR